MPKLRLDFTCSYAYNFRAGLTVSGRSHAKISTLDGSGPKPRLNVMLLVKPPLEFQLHLTLMTVDLGRCSLLPAPHKKRSAQALQAKMRKYLLILACHRHLPLEVEAGNLLNLTNTVAMTQCFTYAEMLMKGIYYRCWYRRLGPLASL